MFYDVNSAVIGEAKFDFTNFAQFVNIRFKLENLCLYMIGR